MKLKLYDFREKSDFLKLEQILSLHICVADFSKQFHWKLHVAPRENLDLDVYTSIFLLHRRKPVCILCSRYSFYIKQQVKYNKLLAHIWLMFMKCIYTYNSAKRSCCDIVNCEKTHLWLLITKQIIHHVAASCIKVSN